MPLLTWTLSYHSTVDERALCLSRFSCCLQLRCFNAGAADVTVDEQRNRFLAAVALEEARKAAESRNFELAKQHIASCQQHIGQTASAETQYTVALQQEMHQMMDAVSDERHYAAEGSRGINQVMMRHQQQRCNDASESDAVMYQTSWKKEMKRRTK
ncbi:Hypothetical protein, putative [Bodo saltans]|uniref:Uncharacterized protein n=1 Tax=Bodo saltans TaxID=75058 RepID=A0A0S4JFF2_BODSA|nr:Hypothetical protein, putative [Bodo saltans]|eukprot:CUG88903.1 Hypothetical protein, putative [Bodo saltans]